MFQVVDVTLSGNQNIYKRLLLPVSDDGIEVTRVLISAEPVDQDTAAFAS